MRIIETVLASNDARKRSMARKVPAICGGTLRGKTIALLGLTFKADTDDMRDAVSIPLAHALIDAGSTLRAYDPVANERAKPMLPARVQYQSSIDLAAEGADAVVIVTDWPEFAQIDFRRLKAKMRTPVVIDLRNFLNEEEVQSSGLRYFGIGGRRRQAFEKADRRLVRSSRPFWFDSSPTMMEEDMLPGSVAAAD